MSDLSSDDDDDFEEEKPSPRAPLAMNLFSTTFIPPPPPSGVSVSDSKPGSTPTKSKPAKPRVRKPKAPKEEGGGEQDAPEAKEPKPKAPRVRKSPTKKQEKTVGEGEPNVEAADKKPPAKPKKQSKAAKADTASSGELEKATGGEKSRKRKPTEGDDNRSSLADSPIPAEKPKRAKAEADEDQPESYLKLDCMELHADTSKERKKFARYITQLPSILGRLGVADSEKSNFVGLSESNTIGREHARISFNQDSGNYELQLLGKNGALVRGEWYGGAEGLEAGQPIPLKPKDPIKLGDVGFYICMPEVDKPKVSYADLCVEALESQRRFGILQMSSRDIAQYMVEKHPYYNIQFGNVEKLNLLAKAVQGAISKCDKIVSVPTGVKGRVAYALGSKVVKSTQESEDKDANG